MDGFVAEAEGELRLERFWERPPTPPLKGEGLSVRSYLTLKKSKKVEYQNSKIDN